MSVPEAVPREHDRTGVVGVCVLKVFIEFGKSVYEGGGVTGPTCDGAIVWGAMESAGGAIQGIIWPMGIELGTRSGW